MRQHEFANRVVPHKLLNDQENLMLFMYLSCDEKPSNLPFSIKPRVTNPRQFVQMGLVCSSCNNYLSQVKGGMYCRCCGLYQ